MKFGKKKVLGSTMLAASLIAATLMSLSAMTSAPSLVVMAKPMPGAYDVRIYGDASGLYQMCEMIRHFSAMKLEWSTSIPSYPSGYMNFALDVKDIDFEKVNDWTYHLSLKGMEEASIVSMGYMSYVFSVKARNGELDFVFSDPSGGYYRTVDITGKLKGDVLFHIDVPGIPPFHYEGSELTIRVHIGMD